MLVRVLGSLEVVDDLGEPVLVEGPTRQRLLALLVAAAPATVPAERLAEELGVSIGGTRTSMSRLRRVIDRTYLPSAGSGYRYTGDSDQAAFGRLYAERGGDEQRETATERVDRLRSALGLWRGEAYTDFRGEQWADEAAAALHERRDGLREDLTDALIEVGDLGDAVAHARSLLRDAPYRDRACGLLMRGLSAQGRQTEALREYQNYRRRLGDEVGVEPGAALQELEEDVALGRPTEGTSAAAARVSDRLAAAPGNLDRPPTPLIGRASVLSELGALIDDHRLVTLIGAGGVGKTRLAIEAACGTPTPRHGTWFVDLGPLEDDSDVEASLASVLGIRATPGIDGLESLEAWCAERELLVILDNCEHVVNAAARLAQALIAASETVTVLATSREPLRASGEQVFPVPCLALPGDPDGDNGAFELFDELGRAEVPTFDAAHHKDAVEEICRRLDGIPLALELAAARIRGLSVETLVELLDERFELLTGGRRTAEGRHATLQATIDWSYELLDHTEREVLDCVSIFAGSFTLDDAAAAAGPDLRRIDVVDAVAHLVDRSLVVADTAAPRYRLLETMRAYGRDRLHEAGTSLTVGDRHGRRFVQKAAEVRRSCAGPDEASVIDDMLAQLPDYRLAVLRAIEAGDGKTAVSIAEDLFLSLVLWGPDEPGRWMVELLGASADPGPSTAVAMGIAANWHLFYGGNIELGNALAADAVSIGGTSMLPYAVATWAAMMTGRHGDAAGAAQRAHELATDAAETVFGFVVLGNALAFNGESDTAHEVADRFVTWARDVGSPSAMGMAGHLKGRLLAAGDPSGAAEILTAGLDALDFASRTGWVVEVQLRQELTSVLLRTNDVAAATDNVLRVLEICDRANETGNAGRACAYAAIVLNRHDLNEDAAIASAVARPEALFPHDKALFAQLQTDLRERLGDRYADLAAACADRSMLETMRQLIETLRGVA